jgi:2-polyprenyl-3-methyl-5-hydroxy-6-metoxy-1,4-benzoquinol methylase
MIRKCDFDISASMARENEAYAKSLKEPWVEAMIENINSPAKFISWFEQNVLYVDFLEVLSTLPDKRRILDVGAGLGYTSVYCALKGHSVTAIEPSPEFCDVIEKISENVDAKIDIWISSAGHMIPDQSEKFDIVIFHSSLHHCDDPCGALRNANASLTHGGNCFLISEPVLNCFRSKAWFNYTNEKHPEAMGYYGGNEHIYRVTEYEEMLKKAGFKDICVIQPCRYKYAPYFHSGTPLPKRIVKKSFYYLIRYFLKSRSYRLFHPLFKAMSLLQYTFVGTK